jgi:hypothetical protein
MKHLLIEVLYANTFDTPSPLTFSNRNIGRVLFQGNVTEFRFDGMPLLELIGTDNVIGDWLESEPDHEIVAHALLRVTLVKADESKREPLTQRGKKFTYMRIVNDIK